MGRIGRNLLVLLLVTGSGCALLRDEYEDAPWPIHHSPDAPPIDQIADRGKMAVDASDVDSLRFVENVLGPQEVPERYGVLTAEECQCRAAAASTIGNLIDIEYQLAANTRSRGADQNLVNNVRMDLLSIRASDERNRASAKALTAFFQLAEAEAGRDSLSKSLQLADAAIVSFRQLKEKGIRIELDENVLEGQRSQLLDQRSDVELSIAKLNHGLSVLLGQHVATAPPIWPQADLKVVVEPVDPDTEVAVGMANRQDIAMLRYLLRTLDEATLPTVRSSLQQEEFSIGSPTGTARALQRIFSDRGARRELPSRRQQLILLLNDQERIAEREIRDAVAEIDARLRQIAVAKESLDRARQRLEDVTQERQVSRATAFDISSAQSKLVETQQALTSKVVAWRIAQVELKKAQGLLSIECGYAPMIQRAGKGSCQDCDAGLHCGDPTHLPTVPLEPIGPAGILGAWQSVQQFHRFR